jgi:hypothetical protein
LLDEDAFELAGRIRGRRQRPTRMIVVELRGAELPRAVGQNCDAEASKKTLGSRSSVVLTVGLLAHGLQPARGTHAEPRSAVMAGGLHVGPDRDRGLAYADAAV